jgi:hypothetical protein
LSILWETLPLPRGVDLLVCGKTADRSGRATSKKIAAPYRSGPSKSWIKVKNPKAPAATRVADGTF